MGTMRRAPWPILMLVALLGAGCRSSSLGDAPSAASSLADAGEDAGGLCHNLFFAALDGGAPAEACCPEPAPDCTSLPDGYGGCVARENQFCECQCSQHVWTCEC